MKILIKSLFFFSLLLSISCQKKASFSSISESHIIINSKTIDSIVYKTIRPYKLSHDANMQSVIGQSEKALIKADLESTLGNFFCDAVMIETKKYLGKDSLLLNAAVFNKGGLRNSLPQGNITIGNIFELMPFDNEVVLLKLSRIQIKDMVEKISEKGGIPVSGIRLVIKDNKPTQVTVNGQSIDESTYYWIVTSDYLANGGDNYSFFKNAIERKTTGILLRDMIITHCKALTQKGELITSQLDGRIQLSK
jgi:2',3'-cyclic-nucleotide 2'-phosphodiesterase (5'-nucleotidase family)